MGACGHQKLEDDDFTLVLAQEFLLPGRQRESVFGRLARDLRADQGHRP
jgi:hypothetical protein